MSDLLEKWTDSALPTVPDSTREYEPAEPPTEDRGIRGREPSDVVQARGLFEEPTEEVQIPAARGRTKREERRYEVDGRRYSKDELEESGLLDRILQTARQVPNLQRRYAELEQQRAAAPVEQPPAPAPQITNAAIAAVYDSVSDVITRDLLDSGLAEEDFCEAFPRTWRTAVGQIRHAFDKLSQLEHTVTVAVARLEQTIGFLNANKAQTEGSRVVAEFNRNLDALVKREPKLFGGLKDQNVRDAFTRFLVEELDATVEQATGRGAQKYLSAQWIAHNSQVIINAAKAAQGDQIRHQSRRFVAGERGGSRQGAAWQMEDSLLDRMIANSGKI